MTRRDIFTTTVAAAARFEWAHTPDPEPDTDDPNVQTVPHVGCCAGGACGERHPWAEGQMKEGRYAA